MKGYWICQVQSDFQSLGQKIDEELLRNTSDKSFKNEIKSKVRQMAFQNLKNSQIEHSKVSNIIYN